MHACNDTIRAVITSKSIHVLKMYTGDTVLQDPFGTLKGLRTKLHVFICSYTKFSKWPCVVLHKQSMSCSSK